MTPSPGLAKGTESILGRSSEQPVTGHDASCLGNCVKGFLPTRTGEDTMSLPVHDLIWVVAAYAGGLAIAFYIGVLVGQRRRSILSMLREGAGR